MAKGTGKKQARARSSGKGEGRMLPIFATVVLSIVVYSIYTNAVDKTENPPVPTPSLQSVEKNAVRLDWHPTKPFAAYLKARGKPVVLSNSVASTFPRWTISNMAQIAVNDEIWGFYKSETGFFGPYYDESKPLHRLSTIVDTGSYDKNTSLPTNQLAEVFTDKKPPPYYALSTNLNDIDPELESQLELEELLSLMPSQSSVNIWLGQAGGTTPCHFDGYHNMYIQLSGVKHFTLFPPEHREDVGIFPFLHPSYGQCQMRLKDSAAWTQWDDRVEVLLKPGEMLYIPPFWIHEVTTIQGSVSVNGWTDISDSDILTKLFAAYVPGLSSTPYHFTDSTEFTREELEKLNIQIPIQSDLQPFKKLPCRMILGALLTLEILHMSVGRNIGVQLLAEVSSRYAPLIAEEKLASLPGVLNEPLVDFLVGWSPVEIRRTREQPLAWEEWFEDKYFHDEVARYIGETLLLLGQLDSRTRDISIVSYIEFLAVQVGGPSRASSFIFLLDSLVQRVSGKHEGRIIN